MGKTIAVVNQKGGTGKTTTTFNFGACLAKKGYNVLLVDFDLQGNLTQYYGLRNCDELKNTVSEGLRELINDNKPSEIPIKKEKERLHIIPANVRLAEVKNEMIFATGREYLLKKYLQDVKNEYDYILIDCSPSLAVDLINALTAADEALIVSNPATFSTIGAGQLIASIQKVRKSLNDNLKIAGVLCNKVDRRTNFAKDMINALKSSWSEYVKIFNTEIPISVRVEESQAVMQPVIDYEFDNKVSIGFMNFTKEYLELQEIKKTS